jgi:hypothetical protein
MRLYAVTDPFVFSLTADLFPDLALTPAVTPGIRYVRRLRYSPGEIPMMRLKARVKFA